MDAGPSMGWTRPLVGELRLAHGAWTRRADGTYDRSVRRGPRIFLVSAAALLVLAAPADADTALTTDPTAAEVSAIRGADGPVVVWSRFDAPAQRSRLVAKVGDAPPADLPVPGFHAGQVDANLGLSADGDPVLVYSRCTPAAQGLASEQRGLDRCDIYLYAFDGAREQKVDSASTERFSELAASYDRGWIA